MTEFNNLEQFVNLNLIPIAAAKKRLYCSTVFEGYMIDVFLNIMIMLQCKYHFPDLLTLLGQNHPLSWMLQQ